MIPKEQNNLRLPYFYFPLTIRSNSLTHKNHDLIMKIFIVGEKENATEQASFFLFEKFVVLTISHFVVIFGQSFNGAFRPSCRLKFIFRNSLKW